MYCSKCGVQNPEDARFCRECGCQILASMNENNPKKQFAELTPSVEANWLIIELNQLLNK